MPGTDRKMVEVTHPYLLPSLNGKGSARAQCGEGLLVEVRPSGQSQAASLMRWPWAKQTHARQGDCFLDVGSGVWRER